MMVLSGDDLGDSACLTCASSFASSSVGTLDHLSVIDVHLWTALHHHHLG